LDLPIILGIQEYLQQAGFEVILFEKEPGGSLPAGTFWPPFLVVRGPEYPKSSGSHCNQRIFLDGDLIAVDGCTGLRSLTGADPDYLELVDPRTLPRLVQFLRLLHCDEAIRWEMRTDEYDRRFRAIFQHET
jgi:hypothetical protein